MSSTFAIRLWGSGGPPRTVRSAPAALPHLAHICALLGMAAQRGRVLVPPRSVTSDHGTKAHLGPRHGRPTSGRVTTRPDVDALVAPRGGGCGGGRARRGRTSSWVDRGAGRRGLDRGLRGARDGRTTGPTPRRPPGGRGHRGRLRAGGCGPAARFQRSLVLRRVRADG